MLPLLARPHRSPAATLPAGGVFDGVATHVYPVFTPDHRPVRKAHVGEVLLASQPRRKRSVTQMLTSFVVHAAVIYAAVTVTKGAVAQVRNVMADTMLIQLIRPEAKPEPPPPEQEQQVVVSVNPPPKGFQTIAVVTEVPEGIPPVDLSQRVLDARDFTGRGVEGGIFRGVEGGTGKVLDDQPSGVRYYSEMELDEPARALEQPSPRYPPAMQAAGLEGFVLLEFIIGTDGQAEPNSIKVVQSSHREFEKSAIETILKSRFSPAKLAGEKVRQLARQKLSFRIS